MKPVETRIQDALLKATEPLMKRHVRRQAKLVRLMFRSDKPVRLRFAEKP